MKVLLAMILFVLILVSICYDYKRCIKFRISQGNSLKKAEAICSE